MAAQTSMQEAKHQKKRHHYVPVSYLKEFTDSSGRIFAYRKECPEQALHLKPDEIAFERYYYSQPLPDNKQDNNRIEDFFSTIEAPWPTVVDGFRNLERSTHSNLMSFFQFLTLMRVRVPATRDMVETLLAESVKATTRLLDRQGKLPPKPEGLENLLDDLDVSIDPHKSIHAMADLTKGFSRIVERLGFSVVRNKTGRTFVTSDNPIVYFDPDRPEKAMRPYDVGPDRGRIEFFFPIAPDLIVVGRTEWKPQFSISGIHYYEMFDKQEVNRINRQIARFGYRFIFSNETAHKALIEKYASISPVLETNVAITEKGESLQFRAIFGQRKGKSKWTRPSNQTFNSV
jgi:hypothetical protein